MFFGCGCCCCCFKEKNVYAKHNLYKTSQPTYLLCLHLDAMTADIHKHKHYITTFDTLMFEAAHPTYPGVPEHSLRGMGMLESFCSPICSFEQVGSRPVLCPGFAG